MYCKQIWHINTISISKYFIDRVICVYNVIAHLSYAYHFLSKVHSGLVFQLKKKYYFVGNGIFVE